MTKPQHHEDDSGPARRQFERMARKAGFRPVRAYVRHETSGTATRTRRYREAQEKRGYRQINVIVPDDDDARSAIRAAAKSLIKNPHAAADIQAAAQRSIRKTRAANHIRAAAERVTRNLRVAEDVKVATERQLHEPHGDGDRRQDLEPRIDRQRLHVLLGIGVVCSFCLGLLIGSQLDRHLLR